MQLTSKGRRATFFAANVIGLFVLIAGHVPFTGKSLAIALAILALAGVVLVRYRSEEAPVTADLAMLICVDLIVICALMYEDLFASFDNEAINTSLDMLGSNQQNMCLALLGVGFFIWGLWSVPFLMGIGGGMIGAAILLSLHTTGSWPQFEYGGESRAMIVTFILASIFFSVCLYMASHVSKEKTPFLAFTLPTLTFFIIWVSVAVGCGSIADDLTKRIVQISLGFPVHEFAWWRVLLTAAALLSIAYVFSIRNGGKLSFDIDAIALCGWTVLLLGVRVLMDRFFCFSWVTMMPLILLVCACVNNTAKNKKTMHMDPQRWLLLVFLAFVVIAKLFSRGLWPSVAVGVPLAIVVFWQARNYREGEGDTRIALALIISFVVEAIAWQGLRHDSLESVLMLAMVALFSSASAIIINRKDPAGFRAPRVVVYGVCACVALLCCLSLRPTARVSAEVGSEGVNVQIGEIRVGHKLTTATYMWEDAFGRTIVPETPLPVEPDKESVDAEAATEDGAAVEESAPTTLPEKLTVTLPVVADHLIVCVSDVQGTTARYDYYYAPWMHDFEGTREALGIVVEEPSLQAESEEAA